MDFDKLGTNGPALTGAKGVLTKNKSKVAFAIQGELQFAGESIAATGTYKPEENKYVFTADGKGKLKAGSGTLTYSKFSCDYSPSSDRTSCQLTGTYYGLGTVELDGDCSPGADGHFSMKVKSAKVALLGIDVPMSSANTWLKYEARAFTVSYGFADGTSIQFDKSLPPLVVNSQSSIDSNEATLYGTLTIDGNTASVSGTANKSSLLLTGNGSGSWKIAGSPISGVSDVKYSKKKGHHGQITFSAKAGGLPGGGSVPFTVTMRGK